MKIQDGKGTGSIAEVNADNRLKVAAEVSGIAVNSNKIGEAYISSSGRQALAAATATNILYVENTSPNREIIIDEFHVTHNGGNTNGNKLLDIAVYVGAFEPTANILSGQANAVNTGSSVIAPMTQIVWDGVGTGMTTAFQGVLIGESYYQPGLVQVRLPSKFIVTPGQQIMITATLPEAGNVSFTAYIHLRKEVE